MPLFTRNGPSTPEAPVSWATLPDIGASVLLAPGSDATDIGAHLDRIERIGVEAATYGDGRLASVAQDLRRLGFAGRMRAIGPLVPDQWRLLWAVGYDEVEVPEALADRQRPESAPFLAADTPPWPYADRLGLR